MRLGRRLAAEFEKFKKRYCPYVEYNILRGKILYKIFRGKIFCTDIGAMFYFASDIIIKNFILEVSMEEKIFCKNLLYIRKLLKLSQKEMAEVCWISVYYLRKIEHGDCSHAGSTVAWINLSKELGILPSQLLKPWYEEC